MGIYIKGMEIPKNCWLCPLSVLREMPREMLVCKITKEEVLRNKVDGSCPLVEVPPHGRLIDADAFLGTLNPIKFEDALLYATVDKIKTVTIKRIKDAPTVIEAEVAT